MKLPAVVGKSMKTWFSGRPNGTSTILAIFPYTGRYEFQYALRLSAANTHQGWLEMAVLDWAIDNEVLNAAR